MRHLRDHRLLIALPLLLVLLVIVPALTMGLTWVRDVGLLGADAVVFASNAPAMDRFMAAAMKGVYGSRIQVCDGAADQTEIQAALDVGGDTRLSPGIFTTADSIDVSDNYLCLRGAGKGLTTIKLGVSVDKDVIVNDGAAEYWGCYFSDFAISGNKDNNTSGHGIKLTGARQHVFERLYISNCSNAGIELIGTASYYTGSCTIDKCVIVDNEEEGVYLGAYAYGCNIAKLVASANATNIKIVSGGEHRVADCNLMLSTTIGLQVYTANNVLVSNTYTSDDAVDAFQVNRSSDVYLVNCQAEDTATNCFYVVGAAGAVSNDVHLVNCGVTTTHVTPTRGLYLQGVSGATGAVTGFMATECDFSIATTGVVKSPAGVLGGTGNFSNNRGYISPAETRTYAVAITAGSENATTYWQNPFPQNVWVTDANVLITTASSATNPTYDLKIDTDGSGVPDGTALHDAIPDTVGTYGSWDNVTMGGEYGVQTGYVQLASNASTSDWIGFCIEDAAGADTAGTIYITIMGQ